MILANIRNINNINSDLKILTGNRPNWETILDKDIEIITDVKLHFSMRFTKYSKNSIKVPITKDPKKTTNRDPL